MNPNPRIGVLLNIYGASVRLANCLMPKFTMIGLKRFEKEWPTERRRRELRGWGEGVEFEWHALLARRQATQMKQF